MPSQSAVEGTESMRLRVEFSRVDGKWGAPYPYLTDHGYEFFLDPNEPRSIRLRVADGGEGAKAWSQFDMDRLVLIHKLLTAARASAEVTR